MRKLIDDLKMVYLEEKIQFKRSYLNCLKPNNKNICFVEIFMRLHVAII